MLLILLVIVEMAMLSLFFQCISRKQFSNFKDPHIKLTNLPNSYLCQYFQACENACTLNPILKFISLNKTGGTLAIL